MALLAVIEKGTPLTRSLFRTFDVTFRAWHALKWSGRGVAPARDPSLRLSRKDSED